MTVPIEERFDEPPSKSAQQELEALRLAVREALDRKRRLGQYAVFWKDGGVQKVPPEALPLLSDDLDGEAFRTFRTASPPPPIAAHEPAAAGYATDKKARPKRKPSA